MTFLLAFQVRVFGQHNVPRSGGVLVVSNHQSYLDPILLGVGLERSITYMARQSLFRNRMFGWLIRSLNSFPVNRGGRDIESVRRALARLKDGWCLVVFPEGTRTYDGSLGPLLPGVLAIAARAEVPIVPAMVEGAFDVWPREGGIRLDSIAVAYGCPIAVNEYAGLSREKFAERIRKEMLALSSMLKQHICRARFGVAETDGVKSGSIAREE